MIVYFNHLSQYKFSDCCFSDVNHDNVALYVTSHSYVPMLLLFTLSHVIAAYAVASHDDSTLSYVAYNAAVAAVAPLKVS